ncbi:hypothetical protein [Archaeoglobus neptunius]|uniref:hypothetical protein n=1 Tax=Archaeoglobus neptunius TaxID=2798580 RepID=UPI00192579D5|nr:hypothetical protein [Archaeoglobus neptunius]
MTANYIPPVGGEVGMTYNAVYGPVAVAVAAVVAAAAVVVVAAAAALVVVIA